MLDQTVLSDASVGAPSRSAPRSDAGIELRRVPRADAPRLDQSPVALGARRVLSPAQFQAALYAKRWTMRLLADYWGLSADHVCRLVDDPQRAPWWDNAVLGLPIAGPARKLRLSWSGEPDSASVLAGLMLPTDPGAFGRNGSALRRPKGAGLRYWGTWCRAPLWQWPSTWVKWPTKACAASWCR